jgi:uncharacterized membrane protein YozB (DUF420 family)
MAERAHESRVSQRWATVRWSAVAVLGVLALVYLLLVGKEQSWHSA